MIDSYHFGRIVIDGKGYFRDVIIFPDRVKSNWWRREGHNLAIEDVKEVIDEKPDTLIIGTGKFGMLRVSQKVRAKIEKSGIRVIVKSTDEAIKIHNELFSKEHIITALHLTC
jgi:hypothetical protein